MAATDTFGSEKKPVNQGPPSRIVEISWSSPFVIVMVSATLKFVWNSRFGVGDVGYGASFCTPSIGEVPFGQSNAGFYLTHFEIEGKADRDVAVYRNGQIESGGSAQISGLSLNLPKNVTLAPWQFLSNAVGGGTAPVFAIGWDPPTGAAVTDRSGNAIFASGSQTPFQKSGNAKLQAKGIKFITGMMCRHNPSDQPFERAYLEEFPHTPTIPNFMLHGTVIPGAEISLTLASITVTYKSRIYKPVGIHANFGNLQIICAKTATPPQQPQP